MRQMLSKMWNDDTGALIATEWVFFVTILVIGIITGLVALRQAVIVEMTELAQAIMAVNQSFSFSGSINCESSTSGSSAFDVSNGFISESSVFSGPNAAIIQQAPCD